ncbi:hypothetical protein FKP32DRAFT_1760738 [Trametes sanguinea]|nr:hypothetical protein FKP32DRAFT_1760738 [Trametes sanguinea]
MSTSKKCEQCHTYKPLTEFRPRKIDTKRGRKGEPAGVCAPCADHKAARKRKARELDAEAEQIPKEGSLTDLGEKSLVGLLDMVGTLAEPYSVHARVVVSQLAPRDSGSSKLRAIKIARAIGDVQMLHWTHHETHRHKRAANEGLQTISFICAQSSQQKRKAKPPAHAKSRDTRRCEQFPCHGWLHIVISEKSDTVQLRLHHKTSHVPYVNVSLPEEWRKYIEANARDQTAGQIWRHIIRVEDERRRVTGAGPVPFRAKAVYYHWLLVCRQDWKLDPDPLVSARRFIQERGEHYRLKAFDLQEEPGTQAVAFYIQDFVESWAAHTQELAMDSTWNTNGGNFELFAAVADANGSGIPLAFMFIKTSDAASGAKQTMLERFLGSLKALGVKPEFTLSDKDWSEINAMDAVWPEAKHQLCFWHALRALKQRLCKSKDSPAPYDAAEAKRHFAFIDPEFVPMAQQTKPIPPPPEVPLRRVRLLLGGRPPVVTPGLPRIRLKPGDIAQALRTDLASLAESAEIFDLEQNSSTCARPSNIGPLPVALPVEVSDDELSDDESHWGQRNQAGQVLEEDDDGLESSWDDDDVSDLDDEEDCRHEVRLIDRDQSNIRSEEPLLVSETGPKTRVPGYQFCPPAHRLPILRLFAKHACQHSLLPERHGQDRTAEDIYRDAVDEMYKHCHTNNLPEVWAYMWNSWYCRARWKLWARSAYSNSIPRKRTTMVVEALWRGVKRLVLHLFNRPPIDLALYAIVTKAVPPYRLALDTIIRNPRAGRAASLSHTQVAFKQAWQRLLKVPIRGSYATDVSRWTCDCGAQKYHSHLLCKHLVQAVGRLPASWWPVATRYHITPFYTVPIDGKIAPPPESMRDHTWLDRMGQPSAIVKQAPRIEPEHVSDNDSEDDIIIPDAIDRRASSPIMSSPDKAPPTGADGLPRTRAGNGAGFDLDDEDDVNITEIKRLLTKSAQIFAEQLRNPEPRFVRNAIKNAMRGTIRWVCRLDHTVMPELETVDPAIVLDLLKRAASLFAEQHKTLEARDMKDAIQAVGGVIQWARDIERVESGRTLLRTNIRRRDEPSLANTIGYRYREREEALGQQDQG